ncbi:hypothetical protein EYM_00105 [Ignicoccus islandicus DSM 13165]|uniref:Uncharacterized protein n=1 Tax=Ignicoccus islandicus DSM 13165 TaxID=940295 RepID=A0A0U2MA96_9CREN|nr:hypothetical protein [Ignicoccus islandicus]ALU12093.1 hypothetical protein EYM_00105 [Ignicoccus islandicus DSM 13165]
MVDEPFVFVVEEMMDNNVPRERLMSCLSRKKEAYGILEGIMLSTRERAPVICTTGLHLSYEKVYERYVVVIPMDAILIEDYSDDNEDVELWQIGNNVYRVTTIYDKDNYEKTIIEKVEA